MTVGHPSDLALERHLLDPVTSPVRSHLAGCAECASRLAEMERQGRDFARFVFPATVAKVEEAAERAEHPLPWLRFDRLAAATVVAAAAAVFLLVRPAGEAPPFPPGYDGIKGAHGVGLTVFVNGSGGVRVARQGEPVAPAAQLRFRVHIGRAEPCHLWILSVDGSGRISRLFPSEGDGGALVATTLEVPGGAVLDGRGGPERLFAVCTAGPLAYASLERAVREAVPGRAMAVRHAVAIPDLPAGSGQASVLLEKRP